MTKKQLLSLFTLLTSVTGLEAMVADSRYFPWYPHMYERTVEKRSIVDGGFFFVTADGARGNESKEHIGIPEIWGDYDLKALSDAAGIVGLTSPVLGQWQLQRTIPWVLGGKMQGQGAGVQLEFGSQNGWSIGGSTGVMHLTSDQRFSIPASTRSSMGLTPSQEAELDRERRALNELLGFSSAQWSKSGFTDSEVHLRWGFVGEYQAKCRKIDGGIFGGVLIPSGVKRDPDNPASVPFGGNGHTGFYGGLEGMFEVREDWELSARIQGSKRLAKTQLSRIPINYESVLFGAVEGPVRVDPGASLYFTAAFTMHDLRDGFGAGAQYCLAVHGGDVWTDERLDQTIPNTFNVNLSPSAMSGYLTGYKGTYQLSKWAAEYVAVTIFYDPDRIKSDERNRPYVVFQWDIPVHFLVSERSSKTNLVSLGVVYHF